MKHINKFLLGVALVSSGAFMSCVKDLDQMPKDPGVTQTPDFATDPKEYLGGVMAKCYLGLAVSGQYGPNGDADIKGLDGGTSQYTRGLFMLNEFTTDECLWVYQDAGVFDLVQDNWGSDNVVVYGIYSRFYTHIAVCNDFIRLARNPEAQGIPVDDALRAELNQFMLEARALRDLSYYNIIDLWGRGVIAWDDMGYGEVPQQAESRKALYDKVVADLEEVYSEWPDNLNKGNVVYGRIGKDAVAALLCRFYLNAETWGCGDQYQKCWNMAQNIIANHQGGGFKNSGLANDYLSVFCGSNKMFMPGGSLSDQNEILWGIPYADTYTEPYGGTTFLLLGPLRNSFPKDYMDEEREDGPFDASKEEGFCDPSWYGSGDAWGCMHARQQFVEKFNFANGYSNDGRTLIWLTENAGFTANNEVYASYSDGYIPIKFTNVTCEADGTMPKWTDPASGLPRIGVKVSADYPYVDQTSYWPNTDLPLIRLADVYMMAAECALRGAGDKSKGREYVNLIRSRAGVSEWGEADYSLSNLLDERAREFYWEMTRRTDLVRFGQFTSGYNWNWKNNIYSGSNIAEYRNLFPLPANVIAVYGSSMVQNPGY